MAREEYGILLTESQRYIISIGDIIDDAILNRLTEEFKDYTIQPVQIVFSVEKKGLLKAV